MSNSMTLSGPKATPSLRPLGGHFFQHHGTWAPGVRLFRALNFRAKALIISAVFLLPTLLLAASLWSSSQEVVDFGNKERAGVAAMRSLVPVLENVLAVRNAARSALGGYDAANDYREARGRTDKSIAALRQAVSASGDPIGISALTDKLDTAWKATAEATNGADDKGRTVFGPVTESLVALLTKIGDDSNLVLDPDIDSFYLVNAMILAMPRATEDVGQVWGWGTFALAKGGLDDKSAKRYYAWSIGAASKLEESRNFFGRATAANPALKSKLDLTPIDAALAISSRMVGYSLTYGSGPICPMVSVNCLKSRGH